MRRIRTLVIATILFAVAGSVIADYEVIGKDVFPVSMPIAKIYANKLGYKIVFQKENTDVGIFYVPLAWFGKAGGQGEIVWGDDPAYPRFTAFYVDGKFSHIRLYLLRNQSDASWSVLNASEAEEKMFDVDTLKIPY